MKSERLKDMLKTSDLVIPGVLLSNCNKLELDEKELLIMAYFMSFKDSIIFNPTSFSTYLGISTEKILESVSSLSDKKYIEIIVKKENGKMREYIDLNSFYEKLMLLIIDKDEEKEVTESKIYDVIENELGRTLSPIEYETISGWLNSSISEELIKEALKEAVLNGVNNLKYIDKILYEWTKKGYKTAKDVKKKNVKKEKENIELFDYDWLDDND